MRHSKIKMQKKFKAGFTLIELTIIIAIIGILLGISTGRFGGLVNAAEAAVCKYNLKTLNREYQIYLMENDLDNNVGNPHTSFLLSHDIETSGGCPCEGLITFSGTTFICNIHSHVELDDEDEEGGDGNGEVPYL